MKLPCNDKRGSRRHNFDAMQGIVILKLQENVSCVKSQTMQSDNVQNWLLIRVQNSAKSWSKLQHWSPVGNVDNWGIGRRIVLPNKNPASRP
mmetsp:Transcript_29976/g.71987  ORF Transcript_29976/g.71987 Transcript_29976/m.71987 type:complete len:92 (-) Transcript_29976:1069-1344(-)